MKQKIRRSQFVLVYGPGSIIEGPNGSRLIPSLKGLGEENCNDAFFTKYEIKDVRMSHLLNNENKSKNYSYCLLSIPSNDSVDEDEPRVIYSTVMFPLWHLCYKRNPPILYKDYANNDHCKAYDQQECGSCDKGNNPNVRFVRSCPNGHLDEVYWYKEVHKNKECSNDKYFFWKAMGSSLEDIIIECPICGSSTTMQEIYKNRTMCTGRFPEKEELRGFKIEYTEPHRQKGCDEQMSVIQKQSSSLRLPYTRTLLKIPKFDESVINLFNNVGFRIFIKTLFKHTKNIDSLSKREILDEILEEDILPNNNDFWDFERYIENHTFSDLSEEFEKVEERDASFTKSVNEEFDSIRSHVTESKNFSRSDFTPYTLEILNYKFPLKVCAIDKLTAVTAQLSYQRKPHPKKNKKTGEIIDSELIPIGYIDDKVDPPKVWYPAYKGVGEGIFITSDENPFNCFDSIEDTIRLWTNCDVAVSYDERPETKNPLFIWWHTLSHAILKSLSLSCGYSSASLRERIYLDEETEKGGILIYNTSPGEDSGMGGLIDLVFDEIEFKKVLRNAINMLLVCSNDPLCSSLKLEDGGVNGSACHNCLLISETSCEHQNTMLDRNFFNNLKF